MFQWPKCLSNNNAAYKVKVSCHHIVPGTTGNVVHVLYSQDICHFVCVCLLKYDTCTIGLGLIIVKNWRYKVDLYNSTVEEPHHTNIFSWATSNVATYRFHKTDEMQWNVNCNGEQQIAIIHQFKQIAFNEKRYTSFVGNKLIIIWINTGTWNY